jgi:hypothetical protein
MRHALSVQLATSIVSLASTFGISLLFATAPSFVKDGTDFWKLYTLQFALSVLSSAFVWIVYKYQTRFFNSIRFFFAFRD